MKPIIRPQFGYFPLIWMCHSRELNSRIGRIHERSLRIVYRDNRSSFQELLSRDKSVTVHVRNLQYLATDLAPPFMNEIFTPKETLMYNTKQ